MRPDQTSANSNLLSKQTELDNTQCRINERNTRLRLRDKGTVAQWYIVKRTIIVHWAIDQNFDIFSNISS